MPERTQPDHVDTALRALLDRPSYAAQTALATARALDRQAAQPISNLTREHAMDAGVEEILRDLPSIVSRDSLTRLYAALPPLAPISCGEYALRLRAVVGAL